MKLFRLLAPLVLMIAVGLAAPAAAVDPVPERPMRPEALREACTAIAGTLRVDRLDVAACDVGDGEILCDTRACQYRPPALERRDVPPLKQPCELSRGTIHDIAVGQISCELRDGVLTVLCEVVELELPWWEFPRRIVRCGVRWTPSEQPMT